MMKEQLKEKTKESLASVLPITVIVFLLSATVVPMETGTLLLFLIGAMLLIVGMGIFQLGAELAMTPLGQSIGSQMIKGNKLWATVLICFFMGAIITIAEPDLQVLANQVASIPNNVLIYTVAGGVGIFLVIAFLRILYRISLSQTLTVLYILLFLLSFFAPDEFTAVADDRPIHHGTWHRVIRIARQQGRLRRQLRSRRAVQHRPHHHGAAAGHLLQSDRRCL